MRQAHIVVLVLPILAACNAVPTESIVFSEPRATDLLTISDGKGGNVVTPQRCVDVASPSHVGPAGRPGAGCTLARTLIR